MGTQSKKKILVFSLSLASAQGKEGEMVVGTRRAVGMRKSPTLAFDLQKGRAPAAGLWRDTKHSVRTPQQHP